MRTRIADPFLLSLLVTSAMGVAGLIMLALAWQGAAEIVNASEQLPFIVSGGLGGLALIAVALVVANIQSRRWIEAHRRARVSRVVRTTIELIAAMRQDTSESES